MVNLGKVFWGVGLLLLGNLSMYLVYPLFTAFMNSLTNSDLGTLAMSSSMSAVSWGGFILVYLSAGWVIPLYLFLSGISER